jgi:serine/threonine-protein kinase
LWAFGLFGAALLAPMPARAEASSADKAAAEALFDRGVTLLRAKNYKEACEKLETSQRIEPAVGTLLYLGECYERLGRTASAWATFREASSLAQASGQTDRARIAGQRADKLEPDLAYLALAVPAEPRPAGLLVRRGEETIKPDLYSVSIPADPGEVKIEVSAPGYETFTTTLSLSARDRRMFDVPPLKALPGNEKPVLQAAPKEPPPKAEPDGPVTGKWAATPEPPASTSSGAGKVVGLVVAGVGLVGIGVGSYYGVRAYQRNKDAKNKYHCSGSVCQDPGGAAGVAVTNDALDKARVSNIAFAAGGGLLVAGVLIYALSPGRSESALLVAPALAQNGAGLTLRGGFE